MQELGLADLPALVQEAPLGAFEHGARFGRHVVQEDVVPDDEAGHGEDEGGRAGDGVASEEGEDYVEGGHMGVVGGGGGVFVGEEVDG